LKKKGDFNKVSAAGIIVTLGIVFGDIGTSPLYVVKAIISGANDVSALFIYGGLSCIFWTLTLQTTIKYVIITLRADNKGEGGILSLFALIRSKAKWAYMFAIIGGAALLADGVITPSLTILSSVEGLQLLNPRIPVIQIAIAILTVLFFMQQFGTHVIGRFFGPMMLVWFVMLALLGSVQIVRDPGVLRAVNPVYAYRFLTQFPEGFLLLGAVFLATTGAEAMYSDLGHCGLKNIRVTWIFVKLSLLLNYFGQGAWVIGMINENADFGNPFYQIMPHWFLIPGIIIATLASIIASQALISGSFTLISEAISLNFWPKIRIIYPARVKGQMYIPGINWALYLFCVIVVLIFRESANMEAAYGLSITLTMLMTTVLLSIYLYKLKISRYLVAVLLIVYLTIEGSFFIANMNKFIYGGWFTIMLAGFLGMIMFLWYHGRKIKNRFVEFVKVDRYFDVITALHRDHTIPKFATNAVFITKANKTSDVESKIMYSILNKQPKRADVYWLVHVDIKDDPHVMEYSVTQLIPGILIKIDFRIGFKVQPRINLFFRQVVEELNRTGEIDILSRYDSLRKFRITGDFRFILIDRIQNYDFDFSTFDQLIINGYSMIKRFGISEVKAFGLDTSNVTEETVPLNLIGNWKMSDMDMVSLIQGKALQA
jgi:KUP system potassium uptake protein